MSGVFDELDVDELEADLSTWMEDPTRVSQSPTGDHCSVVESDEESDEALLNRVQKNLSRMVGKDAQRILHRRKTIVEAGLLDEKPTTEVGGSRMHYLMHASKPTETPLFNLLGPKSGSLLPGNEAVHPGLVLLKVSAARNTKASHDRWTEEHEQASVAAWREVKLGPNLADGSFKGKERPEAGKDFTDDIDPKISLITITPKRVSPQNVKRPRQAQLARPTGRLPSAEVDDDGSQKAAYASFGTVDVDELRIKGASVWDELMQQRETVKHLQEQMASISGRDGGSGSGGEGSSCSGLPMASVPTTSHRADLAEWMELLNHNEPVRSGDVGIVRGARFSRHDCLGKEQPGGILFVVSSDPACAFNMPEEEARRKQGVVLAFLGRVPVHCVGDAPIDAPLVPSGRDDGSARAATWKELDETPGLRALCFGVVWARLPDSEGRPMVLAFVSAHPLHAFGNFRNVEQVASLHSGLVPKPPPSPPHTLRPYQEDSIAEGLNRNSIICLDTGLGKVHVSHPSTTNNPPSVLV